MALCSGLAPLTNNHFGRGALLRGRLRLPAIKPAALISSVSDMQRIFAPGGPWATPWMERVLPVVTSIASRFPERTVFTHGETASR